MRPWAHARSLPLFAPALAADPSQRPSVQQVLHHPWVAAGMEPAMFQFNDSIVASSLANQPPPQVSCVLEGEVLCPAMAAGRI